MKEKIFKVYITRQIPHAGIEILKEKCHIEISNLETPLPRKILLQKIQKIDGIISMLSDKIDAEVISNAPKLKVISNYAVGYNNVDINHATLKGIFVTNTPEVLTDSTADLAWTLLLATARRVVEGDNTVRKGEFRGWDPLLLLGKDIKGKTIGIIVVGRIGTAVAERSVGWKMQILYYDIQQNYYLDNNLFARRVKLDTLLENSDYISLHVPLNSETFHMINEAALKKMKSTTTLINTARGEIIDEISLVKALKEKWIAGAGLDVYENEPRLTKDLSKLTNTVLLPHIGSATEFTRKRMSEIAATNLIDVLEGRRPKYLVNNIE
jgi:glyoxylate reductase